MSQTFEIHDPAEPLPQTALERLIWPLLLMSAWLAFELTSNATLSLVLACVNFGVEDLRTAWWLWQTDPRRPRARACAAFYVASGVWKTAMVPLLVAGTIATAWALYSPKAMQPQHPGTVQLQKALFIGTCAAALLVFLVSVAVTCSLIARWRVWVHPNLHVSRRLERWPPVFLPTDHLSGNQAKPIVMTALFTLILIGPTVLVSVFSHLEIPPPVRTLLNLAVVFGFPMFMVVSLAVLRTRLFAHSPWECWPECISQLDVGSPASTESSTEEVTEPE